MLNSVLYTLRRLPLILTVALLGIFSFTSDSDALDRAKFNSFNSFVYGVTSAGLETVPAELTHQIRQVILEYNGEGREALKIKVSTMGKQWIVHLAGNDAYFTDGKFDLDSFAEKYDSELQALRNNQQVFGFLIADDPFGFEGGKKLTRDQLSQVYKFFANRSTAVMYVNFISLARGRRELGPEYQPDRGIADIAMVGYRSGDVQQFIEAELKELKRIKARPVSETWERTPIRLVATMRLPEKLDSATNEAIVSHFDELLVNLDLNGIFWDGWKSKPGAPGLGTLRRDTQSGPFAENLLKTTDKYVEDELNYRRGIVGERRRYQPD